jgi:hypothetical protein
MDAEKAKDIVYCLSDLLNNKQAPHDELILQRVEKIFGPFDKSISLGKTWKRLHSLVSHMNLYKEHEYKTKKKFQYHFIADQFCKSEQCPIKKNAFPNAEPVFLNIVVGPQGNLKEGDADDFIKVILDRLSITDMVTEAYYFDPYIKDTQKEPFAGSFSEKFLSKLKSQLQPLVAATTKNITTNNSSVLIKKIPDGQIHDRFIIVLEGESWKGVTVGGSLTGFPTPANTAPRSKKHFLITKMEDGDAELLSNILKANIT